MAGSLALGLALQQPSVTTQAALRLIWSADCQLLTALMNKKWEAELIIAYEMQIVW